jgi:hypothetical protein
MEFRCSESSFRNENGNERLKSGPYNDVAIQECGPIAWEAENAMLN